MRRLTGAVASVVLATGVGLGVGCAGGAAFALFTWGLSLWLGLAVGGAAGVAAGVLAVADRDGRFAWWGPPAGALLGLLASGGWVAYTSAYGPGFWPLDTGAVVFLAGWFVGGAGAGWFSGLFAERVGRVTAGTD